MPPMLVAVSIVTPPPLWDGGPRVWFQLTTCRFSVRSEMKVAANLTFTYVCITIAVARPRLVLVYCFHVVALSTISLTQRRPPSTICQPQTYFTLRARLLVLDFYRLTR